MIEFSFFDLQQLLNYWLFHIFPKNIMYEIYLIAVCLIARQLTRRTFAYLNLLYRCFLQFEIEKNPVSKTFYCALVCSCRVRCIFVYKCYVEIDNLNINDSSFDDLYCVSECQICVVNAEFFQLMDGSCDIDYPFINNLSPTLPKIV